MTTPTSSPPLDVRPAHTCFALLFGALALPGCMAISPEDAADAAVGAKGFLALPATTQALVDRIDRLEGQGRLAYGFVGAIAAAHGITATDARDWAAAQDAGPEEDAGNPATAESPDAIDFSKLEWIFGGVDGSRAVLDSPRISALKVTDKGLVFKWETGLDGWGLARDDAGALACLFVERDDGAVVGGKFDWISTSRSSRDLKNVESGYQGWTLSGAPQKCRVWYLVLAADGKRRSNVIAAEWQR